MKYGRFLLLAAFLLVAGSLMQVQSEPDVARACGGFFCTNLPIDQNAERIIFSVNGDGTITATVGINYVGEAEDFSWVVPVPSPPELDVAETESLDTLQQATDVMVMEPSFQCGTQTPSPGLGGGGGGGVDVETGQVGPFDYAIISSEDPDELINWLRDNGYTVTEAMEPIIAEYVEDGMYFLGMRLTRDAIVEDIQPIVMTYESDKPMIPIKLTAVAAVEDMPVLVWIFADQPYMAENFENVRVDFAKFDSGRTIQDTGTFYNWLARPQDDYNTMRDTAQADFDGLAFVTEYVQPSSALVDWTESGEWQFGNIELALARVSEDPYLMRLIDKFPYMTRLRAQMSPSQMTLDPTFIPASDVHAEPLDNRVRLGNYVNPLRYYDCSTRPSRAAIDDDNLPDTISRVDEWAFAYAAPSTWQLSQFELPIPDYDNVLQQTDFYGYGFGNEDTLDVRVMSPEAVDADTLDAFFAGEATPPMFVFTKANIWFETYSSFNQRHPLLPVVMTMLGQAAETTIPQSDTRTVASIRYDSVANPTEAQYNVAFAMLASEEQWQADGDMFDAMLAYAHAYQYFSDEEWAQTLFVPGAFNSFWQRIVLAYPDGWYEYMNTAAELSLTPEMVSNERERDALPFVRLVSMQPFDRDARNFDLGYAPEVVWHFALQWMDDAYGIDIGDRLPIENSNITCIQEVIGEVTFENETRRGIALLTTSYIVEMSAPLAEFDTYEAQLREIYDDVLMRLEPFEMEFDASFCEEVGE